MAKFIRDFDDIIGHKYVISFLKTKLKSGRVPNVILFHGNPGLGKTSIAKVLAITINGGKESLYSSVIDKNESTDCIKLFNMSSVGDDTDSVVSELQSCAFSSTGKKVVILDEVHGMTKKAQDAVLVTLEYLPKNMYVFMCTTEMSMLRDSLISRAVTFNLSNLSYNEIKQVILRKIEERGLRFEGNRELILNLIATWSGNQPRRAINLIETFDENSTITMGDLAAFVNTNNVPVVISLIGYLYGSLTLGVEFIDSMSITNDLLSSLIEVLKVGLGHSSSLVSEDDARYVSKFFIKYDINNYLKFVVDVCSRERVSKRVFTAKFIECHVNVFKNGVHDFSTTTDIASVQHADIATIGDSNIAALNQLANSNKQALDFEREVAQSTSLDALFAQGQSIE